VFRGYLKHADVLDGGRHSGNCTNHQVDFSQACVEAALREVAGVFSAYVIFELLERHCHDFA
jgi:hypothetical protein